MCLIEMLLRLPHIYTPDIPHRGLILNNFHPCGDPLFGPMNGDGAELAVMRQKVHQLAQILPMEISFSRKIGE